MFAGKVTKPNFKTIKLDLKGIYYMPKILKSSKIGGCSNIKTNYQDFKIEKIQTLSSNKFTPEISLSKGNYTKIKPNFSDLQDIRCGEKALKKTGNFHLFKELFAGTTRL